MEFGICKLGLRASDVKRIWTVWEAVARRQARDLQVCGFQGLQGNSNLFFSFQDSDNTAKQTRSWSE